jgi:hypothetical protein
MKSRLQIVGRLPVDLSRRVRAAATRRKVRVHTFLPDALARDTVDDHARASELPR